MDESPEEEVVQDRIDPVTGVKTGEDRQVSEEPEVVDEDVVERALGLAWTGVQASYWFYIGISTLVAIVVFLSIRDFGISSDSSLVSQIIPTMIQSWIALAVVIFLILGIVKFFRFLYALVEPTDKKKEDFSFEKMISVGTVRCELLG